MGDDFSSPLKNVESSAFSVFLSSNSWGDRLVVSRCRLGRQQFRNADQVVGDQIEHEIGSDLGYAAMFGLAHRAVLFAQPKMHSIIARHDCDIR